MAARSGAPAELGDMELMQRVQTDDPLAFGALFDRFASRAYRVAFAIVRDKTRAEDIVQEGFLSVWRGRAQYQPQRGPVVSWIMGTVRSRAVDSGRRHGRHDDRRTGLENVDRQLPAHDDVPATVIERDRAAELRSVLARLPDEQRDVITLAYFGELSATEIADAMSLPVGTVKGRMRLGLQKLRADLDPVSGPTTSRPAS